MLTIRSSSASASALCVSTAIVMARSTAVIEGADCPGSENARGDRRSATTSALNWRIEDMTSNLSKTCGTCGTLVALAGAMTGGCDKLAGERQRSQSGGYVETDSMGAAPRDVRAVRIRGAKELAENSAAAMSRRQSGVLFTIND